MCVAIHRQLMGARLSQIQPFVRARANERGTTPIPMKPQNSSPKPAEVEASKRRADRDDIRARSGRIPASRQSLRPQERSNQERPHHS